MAFMADVARLKRVIIGHVTRRVIVVGVMVGVSWLVLVRRKGS